MMLNDPLYRSFVDPNICASLLRAGIIAKSPFLWVYAGNGRVQLYSNSMDVDGYYSQAFANVAFLDDEQLNPYAAYCLGDMEALLHNFTLEKVNNIYRIMVDEIWRTEPVEAKRLPDAFAKMVLALINAGRINTANAIELISK